MKKYQYKVQGVDYEVEITDIEGKIARVNVNGIPFEVEMQKPINAAKHPALAAIKRSATSAPVAPAPAASPTPTSAAKPAAAAPAAAPVPAASTTGNAVKAPLPGTITAINVKEGDKVNVGDVVIVLEAMKMQNNIEAEYAGTVTSIKVVTGDAVMEGSVLLTIG